MTVFECSYIFLFLKCYFIMMLLGTCGRKSGFYCILSAMNLFSVNLSVIITVNCLIFRSIYDYRDLIGSVFVLTEP